MDHYIGVDFHSQQSSVTVMDQKGVIKDECKLYHDDQEAMNSYFSSFPSGTHVALEATRNWYWFVDLLQGLDLDVKLVHAKKARIIAESAIKTDTLSSRALAHLDRCNFLPTAYIADKKTRSDRELLRYYMSLVRIRTSIKNRVHAVLAKNNIRHGFSDLFGKAGIIFLQEVELPPAFRDELTGYLEILKHIKEQIVIAQGKIKSSCEASPSAIRLTTTPGISYFSALLIYAEIADIKRFASPKKLIAYAGLTSKIHQSADTVHHGHLIKDSNKYIRYALIEAVPFAIRKDPKLYTFYSRIQRKKGCAKAKVATAAKLLGAIYVMLKNDVDYHINHINQANPVTKLGAYNIRKPL